MNEVVPTKKRVFISFVGACKTGKSLLIYKWLKIGSFQPKFDKIYFFYQYCQPLHYVMQKETENLEFGQGVTFEFIDSLKITAQSNCCYLTILVRRFALQKPLLTLPPLGDIEV